jgi:hypothetical protein
MIMILVGGCSSSGSGDESDTQGILASCTTTPASVEAPVKHRSKLPLMDQNRAIQRILIIYLLTPQNDAY